MYVIKAIYPLGGHTVSFGNEKLRFHDKQEAVAKAEVLNSQERMDAARNMKTTTTTYIVVEETV